MKKMMTMTVLGATALLTLSAGIVEQTQSQPILAATAQIAPLDSVAQKVTTFGTMINNPIVPTLLLTSGQQQLVEKHGPLRADAPITWFVYVQTPAWEIAVTNSDQVAITDMVESVLVYPSVDGPANMVLKHPGATKADDGTIHILPNADTPNDVYVKYTANNRYCAFASSPAMAARALKDFAALFDRQKDERRPPLLRFEVLERGMTALAALQAGLAAEQEKALAQAGTNNVGLAQKKAKSEFQALRQKKLQETLFSIALCAVTIDLDKSGLVMDARLSPKPGRKPPFATDFTLPAGVLDHVPSSSAMFFFGGDRTIMPTADEASFRAEMAAIREFLPAFFAGLISDYGMAKYEPFLRNIETLTVQLLKEVPFPAAMDWTGAWISFDAIKRPYLEQIEYANRADEEHQVSERAWDGLVAAIEKQWPGKGLLVKSDKEIVFDWDALIDLYAAEAGIKPDDKEAKEVANVKQRIKTVLGAGKIACVTAREGNMTRTRYAAHGLEPTMEALRTGEARVAAALPEVAAKRPANVFYLAPYALVREAILPIMAKTAEKKSAKQYKTMISAMPPAGENSALACACWIDSSGTARSLLRITANELKNFGTAFNAFTAASLADAADDD